MRVLYVNICPKKLSETSNGSKQWYRYWYRRVCIFFKTCFYLYNFVYYFGYGWINKINILETSAYFRDISLKAYIFRSANPFNGETALSLIFRVSLCATIYSAHRHIFFFFFLSLKGYTPKCLVITFWYWLWIYKWYTLFFFYLSVFSNFSTMNMYYFYLTIKKWKQSTSQGCCED